MNRRRTASPRTFACLGLTALALAPLGCSSAQAPYRATSYASAAGPGRVVYAERERAAVGRSLPVAATSDAVPVPTMVAPAAPPPAGPMGGVAMAGAAPGAVAPTAPTIARSERVERESADESAVQQQQAGGLLTAASVGDADRIENYREYLSRHADEREAVGLDMTRRLRLRVLDGAGHPVNDAQLRATLGNRSITARTHADGTWDFFPGAFALSVAGTVAIDVEAGGAHTRVQTMFPAQGDAQDLEVRVQGAQAIRPQALDLAFAIDVTGSMGDELRYVNREVTRIVERVRAANPGLRVRLGATFYRDRTDAELVRDLPFTTSVGEFVSAMNEVYASGGGDYPEDMNTGLEHALHRLQWSEGNVARVLVLIADAPPQNYPNEQFGYRDALRDASARGIRILPVAASGANRTVEYLFRALGAATSTPYVYLTDDSGIGGSHMEADTDRVAVERFDDLLTRLVLADLRGEGMHEPGPLGPRG